MKNIYLATVRDLQEVSIWRRNQSLIQLRTLLIDSNPDQRRPSNLDLNSQDVFPPVVIDSLVDLEVIEYPGPVTAMAGKSSQLSEFEGR